MKTGWRDVVASLGSHGRGPYHEARPETPSEEPAWSVDERPTAAAEARLRLVVDHLPVLTWSADRNQRLTSCTGAALRDLDPPLEPEIGRDVGEVFGEEGPAFTAAEAHELALLGEPVDFELPLRGRVLRAHLEPVRAASGAVVGARGVAVDLTEQRKAEEALRASVERDGLTGLPARSALLDEVRRTLAPRAQGPACALVVLNLDGFQGLNDAHGHRAGDRVLVMTARRLEAARGPQDAPARLGADEFALLLHDVPDATEAARRAERVLEACRGPMDVGGEELSVSASVGVALGTSGHQRPEDLLRDAQTALLQAKAQGRGCCRVLASGQDPRSVALLRLELELRRALEREDFRQHYEPSLSAKAGKITGFEILLWKRSATPASRP